MTHLNKQERQALSDELAKMKYNRAKDKVRGMESGSRLVFFRNSQRPGLLMTAYDLPEKGVRVTLVEVDATHRDAARFKTDMEMVEVQVEALPDNKS